MNKYTSNNSKGCVLEGDLEYPKELHESLNDYHLAPDKIEIKIEMLSEYQLKIADFHHISIGNVLIMLTFLIKKKICDSLWKLETLLETRIKTKKIKRVLEFNQ